jgi:molybdenum cofactor biosynthesis enzyme MoaA
VKSAQVKACAALMPPTSALVSVSDSCAIGCRFCFRADKGNSVLTVGTLARVLSRLGELGVADVCFTGGEPTDHPEFLQFCKLARQFGLSASVVTAARRPAQVRVLGDACRFLSHVTVSADSDRVRREYGSQRTISGAASVIEALNGPTITLNVIVRHVTEQDIQDIEGVIGVNGCELELSPLLPSGADTHNSGLGVSLGESQVDLSKRLVLSDRLKNIIDQGGRRARQNLCAKQRLYVSTKGGLRICPYNRTGEVSLFERRSRIKETVEQLLNEPVPLSPQCAVVCRDRQS